MEDNYYSLSEAATQLNSWPGTVLLKTLRVPKCEPAAGLQSRPGEAWLRLRCRPPRFGRGSATAAAAAFPAAAREQEIALSGKARFVWAAQIVFQFGQVSDRRKPACSLRQAARAGPLLRRARSRDPARAPPATVATVNGVGAERRCCWPRPGAGTLTERLPCSRGAVCWQMSHFLLSKIKMYYFIILTLSPDTRMQHALRRSPWQRLRVRCALWAPPPIGAVLELRLPRCLSPIYPLVSQRQRSRDPNRQVGCVRLVCLLHPLCPERFWSALKKQASGKEGRGLS